MNQKLKRFKKIVDNNTIEIFNNIHDRIISIFKEKGLNPIVMLKFNKNSIMDFELEEAPGWIFGVLIDRYEEIKPYRIDSYGDFINIDIFAQHSSYLGDFNAESSVFKNNIKLKFQREYELKNNMPYKIKNINKNMDNIDLWEFEIYDPFKLIFDNPNVALYRHIRKVNFNQDYTSIKKINKTVKIFKKRIYQENVLAKKTNSYILRQFYKFSKKLKSEIKIKDKNTAIKSSYPRYDVEFNLDQINFIKKGHIVAKWFKKLDKKILNKWSSIKTIHKSPKEFGGMFSFKVEDHIYDFYISKKDPALKKIKLHQQKNLLEIINKCTPVYQNEYHGSK